MTVPTAVQPQDALMMSHVKTNDLKTLSCPTYIHPCDLNCLVQAGVRNSAAILRSLA